MVLERSTGAMENPLGGIHWPCLPTRYCMWKAVHSRLKQGGLTQVISTVVSVLAMMMGASGQSG